MAKRSFVTGHDEHIGRSDHAGMPKEVMMEQYPPYKRSEDGMIDDTIVGIDEACTKSEGKRSRYLSNQK